MTKSKYFHPIYCSCLCCKREMFTSVLDQHAHYTTQLLYPKPKKIKGNCLECNKPIYHNGKFCGSSCAAVVNNKQRPAGSPSRLKGNEGRSSKLKKPGKPKNPKPKYTAVSQCKTCRCWFSGRTKTCSKECLHLWLSYQARNKKTHPGNKHSIEYNGVKLGSSFELSVAISLDENNIRWVKPKGMKYLDNNGIQRTYFPDFYLPDFDVYLDPKNDFLIKNPNPYHGYKDSDKIKWAEEYNSVRILILDKEHLEWSKFKDLM